MKHAGADDFDQLDGLLLRLRDLPLLTERARGVFYLKSKAFLHFHSDPAGLFADVRMGDEFERCRVNSAAEKAALLKRVMALLK